MAWIWGGLAASAAGAGLSAFGGQQAAKQSQKQADKAKAQSEGYGAMGLMQFQANQAQKQAAEEARFLTSLNIGRPGTYELPYEDFYANLKAKGDNYAPLQLLDPAGGGQGLDIYDKSATDLIKLRNVFPQSFSPNGPLTVEALDNDLKYLGISGGVSAFDPKAIEEFRLNPSSGMIEKSKESRQLGMPEWLANMDLPDVIDPAKFVGQLEKSRDFRTVSYLTAQADQILRKTGPLWQEMQESVLGPIYQGAGTLARESAEEIHRMVARGGSARRTGVAEAMRLRSMERISADKVNNLWQAKLSLDQWSIDNSRRQLAFNQAWTNNIAGLRDEFNNSMLELGKFFSGSMIPFMQNNAFQAFQMQQAGNTSMLQTLGGGLMMIGGGMMNYGAMKGMGDTDSFWNRENSNSLLNIQMNDMSMSSMPNWSTDGFSFSPSSSLSQGLFPGNPVGMGNGPQSWGSFNPTGTVVGR